jgi:ABC-2 type transport system permease protein
MEVLDRLLYKTRFAQFPFLPSYWLSSGVQNWAEGSLISAGFFMLVMLSYVLFLGMLSLTQSGKIFYNAFSAVQSRGSLFADWKWVTKWMPERDPENNARGFLDKMIGSIPWLASDLKAMLVKDTRLFWRDTTQWGQTLVLFGLLGAYILNLRHFSRQLTNPFWIHLVSYLNLGACSLNLATLTTRFVYPQFSLEGKRIWIVGMAPLGINRVVKAKYWLATSASLVLTLGLTWLSCHMLKMSFERTVYFTGAITIMTFCLNGLATGLGVLYPNFKEDNPGKIVNGFGGTFCLILSFLYIVLSVVFLAVGSPWGIWNSQSFGLLTVFLGGFLVLSILVGKLPMVFALRRIKDYEF